MSVTDPLAIPVQCAECGLVFECPAVAECQNPACRSRQIRRLRSVDGGSARGTSSANTERALAVASHVIFASIALVRFGRVPRWQWRARLVDVEGVVTTHIGRGVVSSVRIAKDAIATALDQAVGGRHSLAWREIDDTHVMHGEGVVRQ